MTTRRPPLLREGLREISRLGVVLGAKKSTFSGLTGLGDLITTCISPYGRNRWVGEQIGKGRNLGEVLESMAQIAEGVWTTKSVISLSRKRNVEMPITQEIYHVLLPERIHWSRQQPHDAHTPFRGRRFNVASCRAIYEGRNSSLQRTRRTQRN